MEILFESRKHSKEEIYRMTKDAGVKSLKKVEDGTVMEVESYITYKDKDSDGEIIELLSIMTTDGNVYACTSPTFKESFDDIFSIFVEPDGTFAPFKIRKISGTSKAGREYINCSLVY